MHNKSVAKNKCQYIEVDYNQGLDDTKKSNELSFLLKKLISNKLNTQKFHEKYGIVSPSSRTSQESVFITSSDKNEEDKKKANKKKAKSKKKQENQNQKHLPSHSSYDKVRRARRNKKTRIENVHHLIEEQEETRKPELKIYDENNKSSNPKRVIFLHTTDLTKDLHDALRVIYDNSRFASGEINTPLNASQWTKSGYEGSLKTAIKKVVLKYNDSNKNTNYSKNKNHRSTSFQKLVPADDEELNESDESDESDENDESDKSDKSDE
ncbi:hypothetical protein C1645_835726 [Glomus cerebriforme]|uniref:Uncharacterized protein n=1 Tax=Glomus cerebriforme TaxID=658196 RepID=A0A397SDX0_9GLOM|nr:hypothetical protein C1645_835726 [Glomus cerebriforme]